MSIIFHEGRKLMRQYITNQSYIQIADLLYFRIQGTKYYDKNKQPYFLLPNVGYLANEVGLSKRTCENALAALRKSNFIKTVRKRCHDGAVRLRIFITEFYRSLMLKIKNLIQVNDKQNITNNINNKASKKLGVSILPEKYIELEKSQKKTDSVNRKNFNDNHKGSSIITATDTNLKQISGNNIESILKNLDHEHRDQSTVEYCYNMPSIPSALKFQDLASMSPQIFTIGGLPYSQRITLVSIIHFVKSKGVFITSVEEVYGWLVYMLLNKNNFYSRATSFKHWCNIVIKELTRCKLSKPKHL